MLKSDYDKVKDYIRDSWAEFASWVIIEKMYKKLNIKNDSKPYKDLILPFQNQTWNCISDPKYSPLFIDLYDNFNQKDISSVYANDNVSDYSISSLDENLTRFKNISDIEIFLNNKNNRPNGVKDSDINNLLNFYKDIWEE